MRNKPWVSTRDDMTKDLEEKHRQLHQKRRMTEEKKMKKDLKQFYNEQHAKRIGWRLRGAANVELWILL